MTTLLLRKSRLAGALIGALSLVPLVTWPQVSVTPGNPRSQETVRVQVASLPISADSFDISNRRITMAGNKITIELREPGAIFVALPPPTPPLDIAIGQFPTGDYQVEVRRQLGTSGNTESVGTASFSVSARGPLDPLQNNSDLWWNPNESGWGFNIIQHGSGIIFATWFNYGPDGKPIWYVIPEGQWSRPSEYRGPIYRTTGPEVRETFDPAAVTRTLAGSAVLSFEAADSTRMTAVLTVDGRTVTKRLQRQAF
jgi:hypothetical protein